MDHRITFIRKNAHDLNYQESMKIIGLIVECEESAQINDNGDGSRVDLSKLSNSTVTKMYHLIKYKINSVKEPTLPYEIKTLH
jgi:hypothetical protein